MIAILKVEIMKKKKRGGGWRLDDMEDGENIRKGKG
jgi:hypothetical protein